MSEKALNVKNLRVMYEQFCLYIDDYSIDSGYVTGLIGKNGAGKTTFINAFLELIRRDSGEINILGFNFDDHEIEIKERIAYVNDQFIYPLSLNLERLGKEIGSFYSKFDYQLFKTLCEKHKLPMTQNFKNYSKGMLAKAAILFAISYSPDFIILDEPTANLDPVSRREVLELLYEVMQDENKTILFSTHITSDLDKIADKITLIHNGKIEFTKSKDEIEEDNQIVAIEGDIPGKIRNYLRGITKTSNGYKALCTDTKKFIHDEQYKFQKASIEDIMYYWEIHNE
ncbi:ATP-binding cassette domain-containing protein [Anaerorhabdus furcosa]|uniref:ABC-2 type transport system ATP-binding protein n=1 Tax=Anaerorhabdus furcosa TaxID=118967 RepID=A0A1T4PJ33_9FIRM|nr:ABC transporter ATP-binding protein [Anaerorhabdus furcosa]SJZ91554.1 ABC-2 type transport system ATP-binding protein [Anaerorhabdus furcosa]